MSLPEATGTIDVGELGDGPGTTASEPASDPSSKSRASDNSTRMTSSRTVEIAELPDAAGSDSSSVGIFERRPMHGGPVTAATIRFPPPGAIASYLTAGDDRAAANDGEVETWERRDLLRSRGRVVFARGPWVESRPLFRHHDDNGSESNSNKVQPKDDGCYRVLAFGGGSHGGSTIEGVSGMIFPSSSSAVTTGGPSVWREGTVASSLISVVAYGGRRISFLTGGGLWSGSRDSSDGGADNFASIPVMRTKAGTTTQRPYLEVSDWIHDVRMLDADPGLADKSSKDGDDLPDATPFLVAMGMANNRCEVWGFRTRTIERRGLALHPTLLQVVTCDVRCMTYSMSFYGWDNKSEHRGAGNRGPTPPSLVAASGTVFGEILVWGAVGSPDESDHLHAEVARWLSDSTTETEGSMHSISEASRIRIAPLFRLKGHLGSVFSVKFSSCGSYLASTSDDRSVRLWVLTGKDDAAPNARENGRTRERLKGASPSEIIASESTHAYSLVWTGWGHTARVWDVSFAEPISLTNRGPILVSAGEDSVARIWSPFSSEKEVSPPLRGHRCESVWSVDVCEGTVITGGDDGCVKLYCLESHARSREESVASFTVPKDPPLTMPTDADKVPLEPDTRSNDARSSKKKRKKGKPNGQAFCGMEFYCAEEEVERKLLVATRAGGLFSLDLRSSSWTDYSKWSERVCSSSSKEKLLDIDPKTGSCMGVQPNGECAVVGTTEGWLVVTPLSRRPSSDPMAFCAASHKPAQSISFISNDDLLVFYSRGSVIWFGFGDNPKPLHVMTLNTSGIPLSFAYDSRDHAMYIGDSRGNISYFGLEQDPQAEERRPTSVLSRVHGKEHVTGITILESTGIVVSVGNDGSMNHSKLDSSSGRLRSLISIPIPHVTGLKHVWNVSLSNGEESVIVGGFYGNDFVMLDSTNGYEFLRIPTGGRQRRQDFFFRFRSHTSSLCYPSIFGMAIVAGQKDGCGIIEFHSSHSFNNMLDSLDMHQSTPNENVGSRYSIGKPAHAETINDACWVKACDSTYLVTGSNDCTVKLSKLANNNTLQSVTELMPHESCVRGVCSSSHPNSTLSLLVTCGGKLSMEMYILDQALPNCCVESLCSYRTLSKATIDHRMNAVRAAPLLPHEQRCHLVLSGDSDGNLHLCVVSERAAERRTTIGTILKGNGRPVLCLELLPCLGKMLAFVGTTGGEISVWQFPGSACGTHDLEGTLPTAPMYSYQAHQTGINDLSVSILAKSCNCADVVSVMVCSVGDDQALSTCLLDLKHQPNGSLWLMKECTLISKCASTSALKAVRLVSHAEFYRIYTTGYDEQITLWTLNINQARISIQFLSKSPLGSEGNCIDCVHLEEDGTVREIIAVGGGGIEVQCINLNLLRAAIKLQHANYLLITTGAGFSADSGLMTYECAPAEYRDMCNPRKLLEEPYNFQQFWLSFTKAYLETHPHRGYNILNQWCNGGQLQHLNRISCNLNGQSRLLSTPWWVYSSNVDGHFRLFRGFVESLCEIHGCANLFRCACGIGYANGEPRVGKDWEQWNSRILASDACKQAVARLDQNHLRDILDSGELFLCSHCHQPMRPSVLMFHDTDENVLKGISVQRYRYQEWEALVEDEVATNGAKLVVLEIGCGVNVPAVRQESEEVLLDCAEKVGANEGNGSVCLIRINPKNAEIKMESEDSPQREFEAISIEATAADALEKIDFWLKASEC